MEAGSPKSPGPEGSKASGKSPKKAIPYQSANRSWLAAQGKLPLCFMGLALAWLVAATALVVSHPGILKLSHVSPHVIALAHAWLLGFFVTVATGAVYQIVPVALSTKLWNEPLGWAHFVLHALGVPGMVFLFWSYQLKFVGIFGCFVALGIILFTLNTWMTIKTSPRNDIVAISIFLAAGWLALGVLAGLFLIANRLWGWVPVDPIALLRTHAHLGLIGFFLTLLQGVGFQLLPMFTMGQVTRWRPPTIGIWCSQAGLCLLIPALIWQIQLLGVIAGIVIVVGLISSGIGIKFALETRKKKHLDPGIQVFLFGGVGVVLAALTGLLLMILGPGQGAFAGGFGPMTYAILGIFGGLLPCIAGMMCKIVPFLTWMRSYGPLVGRFRTPPAHSLTHPRLERIGLGLQQLSTIPFLIGAWKLNLLWLQVGAGLLVFGVILFMIDMLLILKHLWRKAKMEPLGFKIPTQQTT